MDAHANKTGLPITQVDAFADRPFTGNPAAVCLLPRGAWPEDRWMHDVAREMNLSETAFLLPDGDGAFGLRWFTPAVEVALCGHATLGSAHALWESGALPAGDSARFDTKSGRLTCTRGASGRIEMDFPAKLAEPATAPDALLPALGVAPAAVLAVCKNVFDYLVEVAEDRIVRGLAPDHARLRTLPVRGVIVTSRAAAGAGYDFVSRFFAPGSGVDEDPVTGSAHCALAPYWAAKLGRNDLVGYQASPRGGTVWTHVRGDRVVLGGHALTVLRGTLTTG
jgi:PhzF family phenazine biosynthesis protein